MEKIMTAEILMAIAMLCQIHPATGTMAFTFDPKTLAEFQHKCQAEYIRCMKSKTNPYVENLATCIEESK
jgi:hypothetical protein